MTLEKKLKNQLKWLIGTITVSMVGLGGAVIYGEYKEGEILKSHKCLREEVVERGNTTTGFAAKIKNEDAEYKKISRISIDLMASYICKINSIKNCGKILYGTKIKLPRYSEKACS